MGGRGKGNTQALTFNPSPEPLSFISKALAINTFLIAETIALIAPYPLPPAPCCFPSAPQ